MGSYSILQLEWWLLNDSYMGSLTRKLTLTWLSEYLHRRPHSFASNWRGLQNGEWLYKYVQVYNLHICRLQCAKTVHFEVIDIINISVSMIDYFTDCGSKWARWQCLHPGYFGFVLGEEAEMCHTYLLISMELLKTCTCDRNRTHTFALCTGLCRTDHWGHGGPLGLIGESEVLWRVEVFLDRKSVV